MKIITLTIIVILFALFILLFVYIYILCNQLDEYDNEHNFRRKEKDYKENNSFIEEVKKSNRK
jgi:multisubunit Na+/H+ antiporter MnhC subunit